MNNIKREIDAARRAVQNAISEPSQTEHKCSNCNETYFLPDEGDPHKCPVRDRDQAARHNAAHLADICSAIVHCAELSKAEIIGYLTAVANTHPASTITYMPLGRQAQLFRDLMERERPNGRSR